MHNLDILIVCLYLLICLSIGFFRRKNDTVRNFTFYKDITLPALICTIFASSIGAGSSMGGAEKVYILGLIYMLRQCLMPLYWLVSANFIAPGIKQFKGCFTISDIMKQLYGKPAEIVTNILSLMMCLGSLSIQAIALGNVIHYFFGIPSNYGICISYFVIIGYSIFGGIRAVIYNDIFKSLIVFIALPIACVVTGLQSMGIEKIINNLPASHLIFELNNENILLLISLLFYSVIPSFDAELVQRYLMAKDSARLRSTFLWVFFIAVVFSITIPAIAYIVKAASQEIEPTMVLPYFINHFMPIGIKGVMIAGLIAIVMSMAEATLNSGALIFYRNIIASFLPKLSERIHLNIFRAIIVILASSSVILIDTTASSILNIFWLSRNFWTPIIFIPAMAGFIGFRTNHISFIASTSLALLAVIGGKVYTGEFATISYMFGVLGCGIGFFGGHYLQIGYGKMPHIPQVLHEFQFKQTIKLWFSTVYADYKKQTQKPPNYRNFLIFAYTFLTPIVMYVMWYGTESVVLVTLWATSHALCVLMLLKEALLPPSSLKKIMPMYFAITLLITLPTISSYVLFTHNGSDFWLVVGVLSAVCLIHIMDYLRAIIYYTAGMIAAAMLLAIKGNIDLQQVSFISIFFIYAYFLFTSYTIVRRKEHEHAEQLEQMELFSGAMAHEVKTPLSSLNICAQHIDFLVSNKNKNGIVELDAEESSQVAEMSKAIVKVSKDSIIMVNNLLSAIKHGISTTDDRSSYSIAAITQETLQTYGLLSKKGEQIFLKINNDFELFCSKEYIRQLLFNLLDNAFKHGGSEVRVDIIIETNKMILQDNGQGIPEEILPRIFDRFYTKSKTGTGIGLAFCRMIVEDIRGTLECESEKGEYTKFVMNFSN